MSKIPRQRAAAMRINVGCGLTPISGWKNFDNSFSLKLSRFSLLPDLLAKTKLIKSESYKAIKFFRSNPGIVEYADATKGLPFEDGTVEVLYSSHMLEHLDQSEALLFLKEAERVLQPGGIIRLSVPDLRRHVEDYLVSGDADMFIASTELCIPKPRGFIGKIKYLFVGARNHQWMYDKSSLCRLLSLNRFKRPEVMPPGTTKIMGPPFPDLRERENESIYVEAKRF